ncbi:hypothetical protein [Collinsella aerofaciens]|uniref:hypothetical protein n=1 Tax=Collinsella aerofaciens TaxID=74426 RepID=UPI003D78CDDF
MADGNAVSGYGNGYYNWHAYISIWQNWITDDKISLHVELGYSTQYAINVYAKGHLDQGNTNWSGSLYSGNNSGWVTTAVASADVEFGRGENDWTYSCGGWIQTTGGFAPGTSWVTGTYTVPAHPRYVPRAPTNLTLVSSTDTKQELSVKLPDKSGWHDYNKINFYRHTDDGDTEQLYHDKVISNYLDLTTTAGHKYTYDCRVQNGDDSNYCSDMSNVVTVFTSPNALGRLELTKTADNKAQLKGYDAPRWKDGYEFQVTKDNGKTWENAEVDESWLATNAPAGTIRYRVRAYKLNPWDGAGDTIYSPWTESNSITTICPPNAPTINGLKTVYAANMNEGANIAITWTPNHPDGSPQSAAQIELNSSVGSLPTVDITDSTTSFSINHGVGTLSVRVRTKGIDAEWGAWSEWKTARIAYGASAWFSSPSTNGTEVGILPYTVEWKAADSTGISYQKIELRDSSGGIIASIEPSTSTRSWNLSGYSMLVNNSSYTLKGYVRNGAGLTTEFTRTFTTNWLSPAAPTVQVEYTDDLCAIIHVYQPKTDYAVQDAALTGTITQSDDGLLLSGNLTIEDGAIKLTSTAPTKTYDIARKDSDGTLTVLGTGNDLGTFVIDRLPPLNTEYEYVMTAHAESGTYITFSVKALCPSSGDEAFNFGDAAETCLRVGFDAQASRSKKVSGNTFHFALGKGASQLPTFYSNDDMDIDGTHSYKLHSRDLYDRAEKITDKPENAVCWFRSAFGRIARVYVSAWNFSYATENYMLWNMGASMTECVWEEPLR